MSRRGRQWEPALEGFKLRLVLGSGPGRAESGLKLSWWPQRCLPPQDSASVGQRLSGVRQDGSGLKPLKVLQYRFLTLAPHKIFH